MPRFIFYLLPFTLILALGVRLLLWSAPLHQPANDEIEYIAVARDLLAGRGWQFYEHYHWLRAPLYPLFLAGSLWLAKGDLHLAALPNIALSVATVYLNYRLALALVGRRAARLAALISALLWTFATFASLYMSETLFTFLFTAGLLWLVQRPTAGQQRWNVQTLERSNVQTLLVLAAGICFGLATLTRSITLLFLPAVALWLFVREFHHRGTESTEDTQRKTSIFSASLWLNPIVFLLAAALAIAPWTVRNYLAYGRIIPVETGLSYNLWAFNEPRESGDTIFHTLENIPNPAERSDYATAKGLARLREDPAILLRKLWPNWVYVVRVKPIEDRFIQENYYSDVGLPLFSAALLCDDALYFVLGLAGLAGLVLWRQKAGVRSQEPEATKQPATTYNIRSAIASPKALLIGWLLYAIGTMLLTHGEARYRHFLFPVLIPYGAWAVTGIANCNLQIGNPPTNLQSAIYNFQLTMRPRVILMGMLWMLFAGSFLAYYPWDWAGQNLARGWYAAQSDLAWARGDQPGAIAADRRALAAQETLDGWLRLAGHLAATGEPRQARNAYNAGRTLARSYLPGAAKFGDFLRTTGDLARARAVFATDDVDQQQLVEWSWRNLQPAPHSHIALGDGLDFGYVAGVYPAESIAGAQARWTNGRAAFRLASAASAATRGMLVRLRLAAPWPAGSAPAAQVCAAQQCWALRPGPGWRTYTVAFEGAGAGAPVIELRSDTFQAGDGRQLGVVVGWVEIEWIGAGH
jgi:4-amino-4-deoxy-L-arabinose transferase-like glycosyltransferase